MRRTLHGIVAAAVSVIGLGVATPVQAAPSCPANSVCLYENQNLSGGLVQKYTASGAVVRQPIAASELYDCKRVRIAHGNASSGTNNTKYAFELVYINPDNASEKRYIGTMAPHKSYNGFGAGDDDTNYVVSPGCVPE